MLTMNLTWLLLWKKLRPSRLLWIRYLSILKTRDSFLIFAIIKVQDLEEELGRVSERLTETEAEAMSQQVSIYM
jgi:hypothetical protein